MPNYKVLSRKYRPKRLDDVIGQDFAVKAISNAFNSDKLAHAFLFTGIRGVGKTTIARIIAMGLSCTNEKKPTANPCGECPNCMQILQDRYEDVLEIDAASHTGVDDVREIISSLKYRPSKGSYKIFIVDEIHMLSNSAFNALLKTIEEPPNFVKFIFCTTELQKIPITIVSRCQRYDLKRVLVEDIKNFLKKIATLEKIQLSLDALEVIARYSEGSIRDSLTILDQCLLCSDGKSIDINKVKETIGLTSNKFLLDLFYTMIKGEINESVALLTEYYNQGAEPKQIIEDMLHLNYSLILNLSANKNNNLYDKDKIALILKECDIPFLNQTWQMLIKGKDEMTKIAHPIEALQILTIRIAYTSKLPSIKDLVNNIKEDKNKDLKMEVNDDIGNDIKKILDIFPEGKIIKN